ncbi:hypothetical protein OA610_00990 [Prochlorococcus sp. AH-716-F13]|nr:hypothetical protein [Prochlorococcus sp. AH-716-F13]
MQVYDALESDLHDNGLNGSRYAEKDYFGNAVCLNERGKIQAKSMSEVIKFSKLPYDLVVSSPSCRARQTSNLAFGGYKEMYRTLVHPGPYLEKDNRNSYLNNFLLKLPISEGTNTIISAHNSVIRNALFDNKKEGLKQLKLEEGGFYVIAKKGKKLLLEHEFHRFKDFSKNFFIRNH